MFEGCANPQRDYRMNKFESHVLNKELEAKTCHNEKLKQTALNITTEKAMSWQAKRRIHII